MQFAFYNATFTALPQQAKILTIHVFRWLFDAWNLKMFRVMALLRTFACIPLFSATVTACILVPYLSVKDKLHNSS